jgi:cation diffusion facilitator CzcD-associated flavoprotein CzcO
MFEIRPYEGAGPIEFGMTQDQVVAVMGRPAMTRKTRGGDIELRFADCAVRLGPDSTVAEIGFSPRTQVTVEGIDVFNDPGSLGKLLARDGEAMESVGIVVLLKLGIALSGFHDGDEDQKSVTLFRRGRWDAARGELVPFRWP